MWGRAKNKFLIVIYYIILGVNMKKGFILLFFILFFFILSFFVFAILKSSDYSKSNVTKRIKYTNNFDSSKTSELYKENKYEEAETIVLEYLKSYPNDILALADKAYIAISKGENEEGIILLDKLLLIDPNNDSLLNNKSWAYNNLGLYNLALSYAEMSLKIKPADEYDYSNKANALYGLEEYEEALKFYDLAIGVNNKCDYAYYGKGLCLKESNDYAAAFLNFKIAYETTPTDNDYFDELVNSCIELKKYNEIIQFSDKRISIDSKDSNAYYYKAEAYAYLQQYESSLKFYDESIKYSEYAADALYAKCKVYLKLNDKNKAYENLKKALIADEEYVYYIDANELKMLKGYKDFDKLISE